MAEPTSAEDSRGALFEPVGFQGESHGEKGNASLAVSQQADSNFYLKISEVVPALSLAAVEGQILLIFIFIFLKVRF